jgi:hypothetical protein
MWCHLAGKREIENVAAKKRDPTSALTIGLNLLSAETARISRRVCVHRQCNGGEKIPVATAGEGRRLPFEGKKLPAHMTRANV